MRFLLAFLLLFTSVTWSQTHYYVDKATGSDSNNGSSTATAWKTIQKAATSATANSIVHIKTGTYYENVTINTNGATGSPIVFSGYGGPVILDGTGTSGSTMLSITNRSNLTFENLTIQNNIKTHSKGISLTTATGTCNNITFRNININHIGWTSNAANLPDDSDNAWGIYVRGQSGAITNLLIDNCSAHDNVLGYSEAITIGGNVDGFTIKNCTVYDNTNIGIHVSGPINDIGPKNGVITGNTCYGNTSPIAVSAGIYLDGPSNITIEKNRCYGNPIGIEVGCEKDGTVQSITVKNNLLYNNQYSGLTIGGYTTDTTGQVINSTFRNNTLIKNSSYLSGIAEITISKASNCIFENNIIYSNNQGILLTMLDIQPQVNNHFNFNCWYTNPGNSNDLTIYWGEETYESFSAYRSATNQDANSTYANPGLYSSELSTLQLTLLSNSVCINSGNPVFSLPAGETDFDGNPRIVGNRVDIGAREYNPQLANETYDVIASDAVPNPFTTQTTINIGTEMQNASLLLYDVSGRKVRQSDNLSGEAVTIERENLNSGFYFYQLKENGKTIASGKLVAE